jgi:cell division protein FtsB
MKSFFLVLIMMLIFSPCYGQDLNLGDLEKITAAKNKARLKSEALSKEKKEISSELSSLKNQLI